MESHALQKPRILVVDDDPDTVATLQDQLRRAGFEVDGALDGAQMRAAMARTGYALLLLDLRLQAEDGLTVVRQLRAHSRIPIIMMSGSCDETDRVLLLELAADDFLVKPLRERELVARIRAVLRRGGEESASAQPVVAAPTPGERASAGPRLAFGPWVLDLGARELQRGDGTPCPLTQAEFRLLETFVRNPQRVWSRDQLLERTRSLETDVFDRTIDVLILRLRRKIEPNPKHPQFICTERGLGYVFCADVTRT